ncbi:MAG TPA: bifunctional D-glycero-beta-D-manno-heptose-7-phosphate kinase/D-glycero-beta-D-manno-heptose 1-phosphate adenylyltransferase HldE [Gammaproteobacteria bacterium]|nr:bifunctional D-glycero-beta-D-manno-heptose-7-phosphate kinase/D-glycero-beta-D-manno-heptose 1-phosphate adenylyltransferase HldE [Gammaproteobacteria bacterium]
MALHIPDFSAARVLVAGDVMLDRYWSGATRRISPEAPVPVVRVDGSEERPGGAGNVAANLALLAATATLLGVTGNDEAAEALAALLTSRGIHSRLTQQPGVHTVTKLRVLSRHQQLLRVDFENQQLSAPAQFSDQYQAALAEHAVVVLSDYGKGTLAQVDALIAAARAAGKPVLVDPKGADFERYRGATVITPNLSEFEAVAGACETDADIAAKGEQLRAALELQALVVTRGEDGMTLIEAGKPPLHLPTHAREVADVTGAGDTVIALLAAGLAAGLTFADATALANLGAGLVVAKLGAAGVTPAELRHALHEHDDSPGAGALDEGALLDAVAQARARGERIVMTNGCFDILHPGHVAYLRKARALGDRLIVAVNDDASVTRLKGAGRPVNALDDRIAMLAALEMVDWVVPFSEDTPARLIGRVLPDMLVKGGDYKPHDIAGYDAVIANGGKVQVVDFVSGYSTTALLDAVRNVR